MTRTPHEPAEERDEESPDPGSGAEGAEQEEVPERAAGEGEPVEPPD